jgi:hypothetical protein
VHQRVAFESSCKTTAGPLCFETRIFWLQVEEVMVVMVGDGVIAVVVVVVVVGGGW